MKGNLSQNRLDDGDTSRSGIAFSPSIISGITGIVDAVIIFVIGIGLWISYLGYDPYYAPFYLTNVSLNAIITVTAFHFAGLYKFETLVSPGKHISQITGICVTVFTVLVVLAFALKISTEFSRVWFFASLPSEILLISFVRLWMNSFIRSRAKSGAITRRIAIVGTTEQAAHFVHTLRSANNPWDQIVGIFDDRQDNGRTKPSMAGIEIKGHVEDLIKLAREDRIDEIIICFPWSESQRHIEIIDKLYDLPVHLRIAADNISYHIPNRKLSEFTGIPVLNVMQKPISGWQSLVKFFEDKFLGVIAFIAFLPLMILIAIAIKLDSPGPIFFQQKRFGFNNQLINVYKYRTMYVDMTDRDANTLTSKNDLRITKFGKILRKYSLDELPQLLNVIYGSMSLVGPRPHATAAKAAGILYENAVEKYLARHKIKPGITGWAQVNGWRGDTNTEQKLRKRVEHDLYYIENWSLWLDIWILTKTIVVVFKKENAY